MPGGPLYPDHAAVHDAPGQYAGAGAAVPRPGHRRKSGSGGQPDHAGHWLHRPGLQAAGAASLREAIKLFWTFRVPWGWTYTAGTVADWVAQFSFGFYSLMLTSLLLGPIVMVLYKPRTWCAFCPMGTMTQGICKLKNKE